MAEVMETKLIPQAQKKMEPKKRAAVAGTTRVMVSLANEEYRALAEAAVKDMREPNVLLSLLLRGEIGNLLANKFGV